MLPTDDDTLWNPNTVPPYSAVTNWTDSPFNFVVPQGEVTRQQVDKAWDAKIRVAFSLYSIWPKGTHGGQNVTALCLRFYSNAFCSNASSTSIEQRYLQARVRDFRSHPAVLAWYLQDEDSPDMAPQIARHQQWVVDEDPDHPTWQNLEGGNSGRADAYISAQSSDIIGSDVRTLPQLFVVVAITFLIKRRLLVVAGISDWRARAERIRDAHGCQRSQCLARQEPTAVAGPKP